MDKGKLITALLSDLPSHKDPAAKVRQDISLLALDQILVGDERSRFRFNFWGDNQANKDLVANISSVVFEDLFNDSIRLVATIEFAEF